MALTRRFFLGGVAALASCPSYAGLRGLHGGPTVNNSRVTVNVLTAYANMAKGFGTQPDPNNMDADGYPVTTPSAAITTNPILPQGYTGEYVWKWAGTASMAIISSPPMVISSGGAAILEFGAASGNYAGGNSNLNSQTAPRIQFYFGVVIQSLSQSPVSNGSGGNLIRVNLATGFAANLATGNYVTIDGILTQTNANGSWVVTKIDAQTLDLQASTWSAAQGASGAVGRVVLQGTTSITGISLAMQIKNSGTFSGFTNLVWCKSGDEAAVDGGAIIDPQLLDQYKYLLNPNDVATPNAWLRFMDFCAVQSSFESDFSQRLTPTSISYRVDNFRSGYWVNAVANGGSGGGYSDVYTCSNPSLSGMGAYVDNEIVQGTVGTTNSGRTPALDVNGRGPKPIFDFLTGLPITRLQCAAPASGIGEVYTFTFTASWLAGLPGVVGTTYTKSYTAVAADTLSATTLLGNIAGDWNNDTTIQAARIAFGNPSVSGYWRSGQAGRLVIAQTAGSAVVSNGTALPSAMTASTKSTFVYNYLLDGWIYRTGGLRMSAPLEAAVELCNAVKANCWFCWGITKGDFVTDVADYFASNLGDGLKFGGEVANEVWNAAAFPSAQFSTLGQCLGFTASAFGSNYGYTALRAIQYGALSKAAWVAAGRPAETHYVLQPGWMLDVTVNGNFDRNQLRGYPLNRTGGTVNSVADNPIYGAYGGLNGSGAIAVDYNISPNRPVDITNATGCAPYWGNKWWGNGGSFTTSSLISGTAAENAPWLQAALDYANGLRTQAFASLVNQFNGTTVRSSGGASNGRDLLSFASAVFTPEEALCAQYDSGRSALGLPNLAILDYEGGPAFGIGADGNNGVNSVNAGDVASLASRLTALGWDVSPWTLSGTDDKTEMATMTFTMSQAWKFSSEYKNLIKTYYYQARVATSPGREVKPAQFGYTASNWGLFPVGYVTENPYSAYEAIHEFNL